MQRLPPKEKKKGLMNGAQKIAPIPPAIETKPVTSNALQADKQRRKYLGLTFFVKGTSNNIFSSY